MSTLHQMAGGKRVAPKRKPRRFMPEWPVELHRQVGEGKITEKTHFDILGSDYAHKRWRGGKMAGSAIDLMNESDVEYITGVALVSRVPETLFGDNVGEPLPSVPTTDASLGMQGVHARQGWYIYDKSDGIRYRIDRVDRLPDSRALILTSRVQT